MDYKGIAITGPSGVGKSSVARRFCEKYESFQIVKAVTTLESRPIDFPSQYEYIDTKEFDSLGSRKRLLVQSEYRGNKYGIKKRSVDSVARNGNIPVLIITPDSIRQLSSDTFLSIFLDAPNKTLEERLQARREEVSAAVIQQREKDRADSITCLYSAKNNHVEKTVELISYLWKYRNTGGVLPERLIRLMVDCGILLENANELNVESASYDLSLGDEYYGKGKIWKLSDEEPFLLIEPYDYAIVTSKEYSNLPRDITARFDLSVKLFCQGVILSNGPQVDPGFRGKLFCLLFNTSNAPVVLKRGQHYATIEFHKLIEPTSPYKGKYQNKRKIISYLPSNTLQGGVSELRKELEKVRDESRNLQTIVLGTIGALLTNVALLLAFQ